MASRLTTPVNPPPLAPTTPIRSRALSPPSKSPIATPPPPSPIPYLPWRDQITWDHLNPHSAPIVDNFDDEWDIKTLVPKTPERKILLSKERQEIVRKRLQACHGTHHVHIIVNDDYRADVHGNNIPDSHMILVTGDPRRDGGILSFDGVDVEEGMIVEKRDGLWGVYEAKWDEEYDEEEEGEIPMEQQIYQVFLEGAGGDHEEAWDLYERFRAHKERQAQKERVYQAMLEELEGNEALAREVHALWCEQEEQQTENSEDEHEEQRVDNEQDVFARATMWAKGFRMGYALRTSSFQNTVPSDVPEDSNQSIESTQEPDIYDCLDQWATRFDGQKSKGNSHSLQKDLKTAISDICKGNDRLIDLEQGPDV
ncbi:hypothetical protein N0V85_003964 [Neurospora sp. IMI 360204]|nr:hypothetical protein N0V85_003964 [Neurospora sp. IMI 360204]